MTIRAPRTGHAKSLSRSDSSSRAFARTLRINGNTVCYASLSVREHAAPRARRRGHAAAGTWEATSGSRSRVPSTSSLAFETKYTIASRTAASTAMEALTVCAMCCSALVLVKIEASLARAPMSGMHASIDAAPVPLACYIFSMIFFGVGSDPVLPGFDPVGFRPRPRPRTSDDNLQGIYLLRFDFFFSNSIKSNYPFLLLFLLLILYLFYYSFIILSKFDLI